MKDFEISNLDFVKEPNQAPISGLCDGLTIISSMNNFTVSTNHNQAFIRNCSQRVPALDEIVLMALLSAVIG